MQIILTGQIGQGKSSEGEGIAVEARITWRRYINVWVKDFPNHREARSVYGFDSSFGKRGKLILLLRLIVIQIGIEEES